MNSFGCLEISTLRHHVNYASSTRIVKTFKFFVLFFWLLSKWNERLICYFRDSNARRGEFSISKMIKRFASLFGRFFRPTSLLFASTLVFRWFSQIFFLFMYFSSFRHSLAFFHRPVFFNFSTTRAPCARAKSVNNNRAMSGKFSLWGARDALMLRETSSVPSTEAAPRGRKKNTFQFSQFVFEGELFFPFCIFILFFKFFQVFVSSPHRRNGEWDEEIFH